ncbi:hypothetical protein AX16_006508 [Volvariella volvacea WC 439]|nr:hypothetical protein AX16_006508 [Volvariella volvacea WC 439]
MRAGHGHGGKKRATRGITNGVEGAGVGAQAALWRTATPRDLLPNGLDEWTMRRGSFAFISRFRALSDNVARSPLLTLREIAMTRLMNRITDEPNWEEQIFSDDAISKWRQETVDTDANITPNMFTWCIAELQHRTALYLNLGGISVFHGDVVKSDIAIPSETRDQLWLIGGYGGQGREGAGPGASIGVPLGVWKDEGIGGATPSPRHSQLNFLLLARITSYINNLHPQRHAPLYTALESILTSIIPLWDMTLTALRYPDDLEIHIPRIWYGDGTVRSIPVPDTLHPYKTTLIEPDAGVFPEPRADANFVDLRRDYAHRGLQVIVQLTNICLTPDKPGYEGEEWHFDGLLNEHICATAMYFYTLENTTPAHISFRHRFDRDQLDSDGLHSCSREYLSQVFGIDPSSSDSTQHLGSIEIRENRVVTFPNVLQHRLEPFTLADSSKPGQVKILTLYLVDPNIRIVSTASVPPQQKEWWAERVRDLARGGERGMGRLPVELFDQVMEDVEEFPIGMEEAKKVRVEVERERKRICESYTWWFVHR